jgi:hypothetical protein
MERWKAKVADWPKEKAEKFIQSRLKIREHGQAKYKERKAAAAAEKVLTE